ncbi:MAG: nucleoside phosphorylase [Oscillospiraceae bacterium]|jgi:uridine phosphorylase|nr:nucleoside phosphorylase [Oscillospiraceae bacterium]
MIRHGFDGGEELLKPVHLSQPVEGFPKTVLVTFQRKVVEALQKRLPVEAVSTISACVEVPIYRFSYQGQTLGLYLTTIGGPATVGILEEVWVKGAEKVLLFGTCGGLDAALPAGHLIVPTAAYRDEGTSFHYLPPSDYVEVPTAERLAAIFDELALPYVRSRTWTTDAIYRETPGKVAERRAEGCGAVEMECASVMAAGQFRGKPVYQFLYTADSLAGSRWERGLLGAHPESDYERYLSIALETAIRL